MTNRIKSRVAEVIGFERNGVDETVKVDPGGTSQTCDHYSPCGIDAPPLPGDFAALDESSGTGSESCTGYADPTNTRKASGGEFRAYARDDDGAVVGEAWFKGDGTIVFENLNGWGFSISPAGVGQFSLSSARFTDAAGQPLARVGDLVSVVIPPLANSGGPVAPGGVGVSIPAAGQIISGNNSITG